MSIRNNPLTNKLRNLRKNKNMSLRTVAAQLQIDVAILSKMERGERPLTKEIVTKLARIYKCNTEELLVSYLGERILKQVDNEKLASEAMKVAEEQLMYKKQKSFTTDSLIKNLKRIIQKDKRIQAAWLYGSYARNEATAQSDVDLMVRFSKNEKISLFDMAGIVFDLEKQLNKKIDIVEEGMLHPHSWKTAKEDMILIYG